MDDKKWKSNPNFPKELFYKFSINSNYKDGMFYTASFRL